MAYAGSDGTDTRPHLAASADGRGDEADSVSEQSPCAVRLRDHTLRLWFAGRRMGDTDGADRIWAATFTGSDDWPTGA
jgi:hypothetical protein